MNAAITSLVVFLYFARFNCDKLSEQGLFVQQDALFVYATDFVQEYRASRIFSALGTQRRSKCRSPPLLKFSFKILEEWRSLIWGLTMVLKESVLIKSGPS